MEPEGKLGTFAGYTIWRKSTLLLQHASYLSRYINMAVRGTNNLQEARKKVRKKGRKKERKEERKKEGKK